MTARLEAALLELAAAIREELREAAQSAPDRLLSIPEAAATLGIGRTRLYAEMDAGRLRTLRAGRRRLIPASALTEYTETKQAARSRHDRTALEVRDATALPPTRAA
jgi:excisionase family DNA binding protein